MFPLVTGLGLVSSGDVTGYNTATDSWSIAGVNPSLVTGKNCGLLFQSLLF